MKRFSLLAILFLVWGSQAALGQQYDFRYKSDVKVAIGTDTLKNAWAGGINSPQFSKIHLNNDTQEDLFIFDRSTYKVSTFVAVNINGVWGWQYAPQYERIFPTDLDAWVLLRDFNNDGRKDIFTKGSVGVKVYQNMPPATAGNPPSFQAFSNFLTYNGTYNLKISANDVPVIDDLDNDGDLDILAFEWSAGKNIEFYRNTGGVSLTYTLQTSSWGNISKCASVCKDYYFGSPPCRTSQPMHIGGSSLLTLDLDGDGDKDLLIGQEDCPGLARFMNTGTNANPVFTSYQVNFPTAANPANFNSFPAAFYEDVTFDGIKDLLIAPAVFANLHSDVNMTKSSWLYRNTGSNTNPVFSFQRKDFLQNDMLEVGEAAAPAFADVDADGDLDLLVGTYADMETFSSYKASIRYYKNIGTATNPLFKLETADYLGLSSQNLLGIKPQFTDINGDNAPDLVFASVSGSAGNIRYILNTAAAGQPVNFPVGSIQVFVHGGSLNDIPAFYDLDGDGDKDLMIATNSFPAGIHVYENTGSATQPNWVFRFDNAGSITGNPVWNPGLYITITDLNNDNNPDLLTGDNSGEIRLYENFLYRLKQTLTPQSLLFHDPLTNTLKNSVLGGGMGLAAADLTGDGRPELVAGNLGGGLHYFNLVSVGPAIPVSQPQPLGVSGQLAAVQFSIFPNPANSSVTIESTELVSIQICDLVGKKVLENPDLEKVHLTDISKLSKGVYLVRLQTAGNRIAVKKLVVN